MKLHESSFGKLADGRETQLFTLENDNKVTVKITNYGGIITAIEMPDNKGTTENIVCGFDNLKHYLSDDYLSGYPYFGALIGRFGNRIAGGHLEIEGNTYRLAKNNGPNHLHGGETGFDKRLWEAKTIENDKEVGVELSYHSADMEENYPGNLQVKCIYTLNNKNELGIQYYAETDKTTVVNLTNHTYFNLTAGKKDILHHELKLNSNKMTVMMDQIPTGNIEPVEGTVHDFKTYKKFIMGMSELPTGYDHNYVLDNDKGELNYAGTLREEESGRQVEVYTTQPGLQLYTGYWIPEMEINDEKKFGKYAGVALETQHYPDSVHHEKFPSTELKPGEKYNQKTIYKLVTE